MTKARHVTSLRALTDADLRHLARRGSWFGTQRADGYQPLRGRIVGSYFQLTSTRTRTAFGTGAMRLGASHLGYGPNDMQLNTGESVADTALILCGMLDALVVRTAGGAAEFEAWTGQDRMSVINAMGEEEHPTQALADLAMLTTRFGAVDGLRILYVGEGNNTAAALALGLSRFDGVRLTLCTPAGYGLAAEVVEEAQRAAVARGGAVHDCHDLAEVQDGADVVYTTRWQTTGTAKADPDWRTAFSPFRVDEAVLARHPGAVFMHDLPAHRGDEVTAGVLDGPSSVAFEQAQYKLHGAMALLEWCLLGPVS
jgi:ornithine carbamoyltransferase